MNAVTAGAVGYRLGAASRAIGGQTEPAVQRHASVALPAGLADVGEVHRRARILRRQNRMLPVAGGADWRRSDALCDGSTVDAGAELFSDLPVAHAARVWNRFVEGC